MTRLDQPTIYVVRAAGLVEIRIGDMDDPAGIIALSADGACELAFMLMEAAGKEVTEVLGAMFGFDESELN